MESAEYWKGYERGLVDGIPIGRRQVEQENAESHETAARVARIIAETPPYADLCEFRGEPERAEHQRRILTERGVSA